MYRHLFYYLLLIHITVNPMYSTIHCVKYSYGFTASHFLCWLLMFKKLEAVQYWMYVVVSNINLSS